jgi:hypothetical protein
MISPKFLGGKMRPTGRLSSFFHLSLWLIACSPGGAQPVNTERASGASGAQGGSGRTSSGSGQAVTGAPSSATGGSVTESGESVASGSVTESGGGGAEGSTASAVDDATTDAVESATADGPSDAPATDDSGLCVTGGTELCDGFESGSINAKLWGMKTTSGTSLAIDSVHVHAGSYALHIKVVAGQSNTAQLTDAVTFPAKNNLFYTRAFFYFSPDLPADMMGGFHMAYLLATGNNTLGYVEAGLGSAGNKQYLGYSEYYGDGPNVAQHGPTFTEFGPDSSKQVVPMTWICLELMQGGDPTTGTTSRRVWVNDTELTEQVSNYTDRPPPTFAMMSIGVLQYHVSPILTDIWIDDVRISSDRIGCDLAGDAD